MYYTIYQITNLLNNKIYIGKHKTKNLDDLYFGSGKYLKHAINKYGIENFKKEILFIFDSEDEMDNKERELVTEEFCSRKDTYNICEGGSGGFGYINSNSLSVRNFGLHNSDANSISVKARKTKKHLWNNDLIWREKYSKSLSEKMKRQILEHGHPWAGRRHTEETKQKMRKSKNVGESNPQFGTIWITNGIENKKINKIDIIPEGWYKGRKMPNNGM